MHIITAVTGASGAIYSKRFIEVLNEMKYRQTLLISGTARDVFAHELNMVLPENKDNICKYITSCWQLPYPDLINYEQVTNLNSAIASGSRAPEAMVVIPCTMGTIARVSQGLSANLLERSFDVMLKEKKKLIVVPRETPLNQIHLKNMLNLSQLGVDIIPAMPAFYHMPETIKDIVNFVVGRVIEHLELDHSLYQKWAKKTVE